MDEYEIEFAASAANEFRSLSPDMQRRIGGAIEALRQVPRPPGVRKLQVHEDVYRLRVGDYRVVYEIDDNTRGIRITRVRHRRDAYR